MRSARGWSAPWHARVAGAAHVRHRRSRGGCRGRVAGGHRALTFPQRWAAFGVPAPQQVFIEGGEGAGAPHQSLGRWRSASVGRRRRSGLPSKPAWRRAYSSSRCPSGKKVRGTSSGACRIGCGRTSILCSTTKADRSSCGAPHPSGRPSVYLLEGGNRIMTDWRRDTRQGRGQSGTRRMAPTPGSSVGAWLSARLSRRRTTMRCRLRPSVSGSGRIPSTILPCASIPSPFAWIVMTRRSVTSVTVSSSAISARWASVMPQS
jgi:hypothetical protein